MHTLRHLVLILPLVAAITPQIAFGESDRHITYMQQHKELIDRDPQQDGKAAGDQDSHPEGFAQGLAIGKLSAALALNDRLSAYRINIEARQDRVVLSGRVKTQPDKQLAQDIAQAIDGIEPIENRILVQADAAEHAHDYVQRIVDATITAEVKAELSAQRQLQNAGIDVNTQQQVVTLRGTVQSQQQKDAAEAAASRLENTEGVRNQLKVES